jgi:hypothetical protein
MTSNWKQFWLSEQRTAILVCLPGVAVGLTIGFFIEDWAESFHSIEIFSYQIPSPILFGAVVSLDVHIFSVMAIWSTLKPDSKLYVPVTWFLLGIPFGLLTIFNLLSDRLVSVGFITPYIFDLLLPCILIMFVGMDAMCFLAMNALYLLPFYIVFTGIVWLLELSRSIA